MANTRISNLTASASNLAATDVTPVVQTTGVGPVKMTGLQLAGGLLGSTALTGATVTTSQPVLYLSQTWNAGGVSFTGLKFNAAGSSDANSASASLLLDLQVGGTSAVKVRKDGYLYMYGNSVTTDTAYIGPFRSSGNNLLFVGPGFFSNGTSSNAGFFDSRYALVWNGNTGSSYAPDLFLTRATTATLQLGAADAAAPVAQTFKVQSVVAGTTNTAGTNFTIQGSQGTGTGAGGSIIFQVAPAGSSGTAQNAYSTALTINSAGATAVNGATVVGNTKFAVFGSLGLPSGTNKGIASFTSTSGVALTIGAVGTAVFLQSMDDRSSNSTPYSILLNPNGGNVGVGYTGTNGVFPPGATLTIAQTGSLGWDSGTSASLADLTLYRDNSNILALRNGTNAQRFNVYNTYTSSTNYETFKIDWITTANTCLIGTEKGSGGGTARALEFQTDGTTRMTITATSNTVTFAGSALSGATSYSTSGGAVVGLDIQVAATRSFYWTSGASLFSTGAGILAFEGRTATFPALKRISSGNCLQVIAADNTASAGFIVGNQALATSATDGFLYVPTCAGTPTGTPTTQTGTAPIVVDTTNNKLYFYSGGQWRDAGP